MHIEINMAIDIQNFIGQELGNLEFYDEKRSVCVSYCVNI